MIGISLPDFSEEFCTEVKESYESDPDILDLSKILSQDRTHLSVSTTLGEPWQRLYQEGRISLLSRLVYSREKHISVVILQREYHIQQKLQVCHDDFLSGHLSEERTLERVRTSAWWPKWKVQT